MAKRFSHKMHRFVERFSELTRYFRDNKNLLRELSAHFFMFTILHTTTILWKESVAYAPCHWVLNSHFKPLPNLLLYLLLQGHPGQSGRKHGLRTPGEEIAFTARPKINFHSQIFAAQIFRLLWFMSSLGVRSLCFILSKY